jgi:hypothetical protein
MRLNRREEGENRDEGENRREHQDVAPIAPDPDRFVGPAGPLLPDRRSDRRDRQP